MPSICQLRNAGIVDNDGKIAGFEGLGVEQSTRVLRQVLHVMRTTDVDQYVKSRRMLYTHSGREKYVNFPDDVVYLLLSRYLSLTGHD